MESKRQSGLSELSLNSAENKGEDVEAESGSRVFGSSKAVSSVRNRGGLVAVLEGREKSPITHEAAEEEIRR